MGSVAQRMQQQVETRPVLEIALAVIADGERLLISRRPAGSHLAGYWEFPGGKRRPEESIEACAEREAAEEVGIACRAESCLAPLRFEYEDRIVVLHPVRCRYLDGEPRALGVSDWKWVSPAELSAHQFPPANDPLLAELQVASGVRPPGSDA